MRFAERLSGCVEGGDVQLASTTIPELWRLLFADWHTDNYFSAMHAEGLVQTLTGVRPGDPLADLEFVLVFIVIQRRLLAELDAAGLVVLVPVIGDTLLCDGPVVQRPVLPSAYVDDLPVRL